MGDDPRSLIESRDPEYGEAWLISRDIIKTVGLSRMARLMDSPYFYLWVMIVGKLCRLLYNPTNMDTWRDISGYAELALRDMGYKNAKG